MKFKRVLITGGAGFVGSNLAVNWKDLFPDCNVIALDNLKRRGSELNLQRLASHEVEFVHGDVRNREDLEAIDFDLLIDCAAEPSVHAGTNGSSDYVINTNLIGTINSLEAARKNNAAFLLLSTSRVYPIEKLNRVPFCETETRFNWNPPEQTPGICEHGVSELFSLEGARSFYGASKLSAELMVREFAFQWKMPALINRCGVIAGPWQMGKADQGVVALWVSRHYFQQPLKYIGFGGHGKQVRDLLHVDDLFELIVAQSSAAEVWDGRVYNVGGGQEVSVSLAELTELCSTATGNEIAVAQEPDTNKVDLRIYMTDARKAREDFGWKPKRSALEIVKDINSWIEENESEVKHVLHGN
jgi:CDP-paratose 2-epimerase